jgi:hypothetical protein
LEAVVITFGEQMLAMQGGVVHGEVQCSTQHMRMYARPHLQPHQGWSLYLCRCVCTSCLTGVYEGKPVAVKVFLPGASPDGSTCEEIAITCNNSHNNLTQVVAVVVDDNNSHNSSSNGGTNGASNGSSSSSSAYDPIKGLVMVLVQGKTMADRPTSQHLLRCM